MERYKRRSVNFDMKIHQRHRRQLQALRKSLERKDLRSELIMQRRNLKMTSPDRLDKCDSQSQESSKKTTTHLKKTLKEGTQQNRRLLLEKYKAEKALKKELAKKKEKPAFKCGRVKYPLNPFDPPASLKSNKTTKDEEKRVTRSMMKSTSKLLQESKNKTEKNVSPVKEQEKKAKNVQKSFAPENFKFSVANLNLILKDTVEENMFHNKENISENIEKHECTTFEDPETKSPEKTSPSGKQVIPEKSESDVKQIDKEIITNDSVEAVPEYEKDEVKCGKQEDLQQKDSEKPRDPSAENLLQPSDQGTKIDNEIEVINTENQTIIDSKYEKNTDLENKLNLSDIKEQSLENTEGNEESIKENEIEISPNNMLELEKNKEITNDNVLNSSREILNVNSDLEQNCDEASLSKSTMLEENVVNQESKIDFNKDVAFDTDADIILPDSRTVQESPKTNCEQSLLFEVSNTHEPETVSVTTENALEIKDESVNDVINVESDVAENDCSWRLKSPSISDINKNELEKIKTPLNRKLLRSPRSRVSPLIFGSPWITTTRGSSSKKKANLLKNLESSDIPVYSAAETSLEAELDGGLVKSSVNKDENLLTIQNNISSESKRDVDYFKEILQKETRRIKELVNIWEKIMENEDLTEMVIGDINSAIGLANLLRNKKFKQFDGLIGDCEMKRGENLTTTDDLQGFWDMMSFQIEDIHQKFEKLQQLKANNWQETLASSTKKRKTPKRKAKKRKTSSQTLKEHITAARKKIKETETKENIDENNQMAVEESIGKRTRSSSLRTGVMNTPVSQKKAKQLRFSLRLHNVDKETSKDVLSASPEKEMSPEKYLKPSNSTRISSTPSRRSVRFVLDEEKEEKCTLQVHPLTPYSLRPRRRSSISTNGSFLVEDKSFSESSIINYGNSTNLTQDLANLHLDVFKTPDKTFSRASLLPVVELSPLKHISPSRDFITFSPIVQTNKRRSTRLRARKSTSSLK